jgi:hypothetical protein
MQKGETAGSLACTQEIRDLLGYTGECAMVLLMLSYTDSYSEVHFLSCFCFTQI